MSERASSEANKIRHTSSLKFIMKMPLLLLLMMNILMCTYHYNVDHIYVMLSQLSEVPNKNNNITVTCMHLACPSTITLTLEVLTERAWGHTSPH